MNHESDTLLVGTLAQAVTESLDAGEACIVVATAAHHTALTKAAKALGTDLSARQKDGTYIPLDADETLASFMVDDMPVWDKFDAAISPILIKAAKTNAPVRAFGEMVSLLWQRGKQEAALELERLWNRLATNHEFILHCDSPVHFRQMTRPSGQASKLQQETARRKRAEHALQVSEADRKQLQELSAVKDEYLSIASHQLRTPATIVKQYLALLLDSPDTLTPGQREKLRLAFESNERQLKTINDLLMAASMEAGTLRLNRQACDVGQLIHDVATEQTAETARRGQTIEIVLPPLPHVQVDVRYMRMVLENLLSNASKYSPPQTHITISAGQRDDGIFIAVTDTGIGISKKDQEQLYKKFSRIDGNFTHSIEGTGLGLYWVKKIVELHSGTLQLQSRVGHGSTFTVTLPL